MDKVNLLEKFGLFNEHWNPKIIAELNGQQVKIVKLQGEFVWHKHDEEDELFYVVKGRLSIALRNKKIELDQGEFFVVPRGMEHRPSAAEEAWVLLFEPASTINTGNVVDEKTKKVLESI